MSHARDGFTTNYMKGSIIMSSKDEQQILVFPRQKLDEIGDFQGLKKVKLGGDPYHQLMTNKNTSFMRRGDAETDPNYKQIIPYVYITYKDNILTYERGSSGGEKRLEGYKSIGFGGHIEPIDQENSISGARTDWFARGMLRELREELAYLPFMYPIIRGFLNDDSNDVGKVHFGIVMESPVRYEDEIDCEKVEQSIARLRWESISRVKKDFKLFESWSKIVIRNLL